MFTLGPMAQATIVIMYRANVFGQKNHYFKLTNLLNVLNIVKTLTKKPPIKMDGSKTICPK
jgi:hypothetical protein